LSRIAVRWSEFPAWGETAEMKHLIKSAFQAIGYDIAKLRHTKVTKPIDENFVAILDDAAFQASVKEVSAITMLDAPRLANLWQLARMSNPAGSLIEVGADKGGGALHLSNACPARPIFVCDTFEGFGNLTMDQSVDRLFYQDQFDDTNFEDVKQSWTNKRRDVRWIRGYFPESAENVDLSNISFAHIDTDLYESTAKTIEYLRPRLIDHSIVVFDDYLCSVDGVIKAVGEFTCAHPDWAAFPLFPGQGLMIHRNWFD
jgi:hypothetical protein